MLLSEPGYYQKFLQWYGQVGNASSLFFVDGNVTFYEDAIDNVTFVVALPPSGTLGWMDKAKNMNQHWLFLWQEDELVQYGRLAQIQGTEEIGTTCFISEASLAMLGKKMQR
jgi:hypothetical protein